MGAASYTIPGSNVIYLATTGSDSNAGTLAAPKGTLAGAISAVPAGGTIVVREGVYNEGGDTQNQAYTLAITIQKNVTIQNYPNEAVWFDGSVPITSTWTQSGSRWSTPYTRVFDRTPTDSHAVPDGNGVETGAGGWFRSSTNPQACWPDMVLLDGVQLTQVQTLAEVTSGTFYVAGATGNDAYWFVGATLYIGDNPAGHEIRYANKTKFATFAGVSYTSTLRGVGFRRYASYSAGLGVLYVQHKLAIENCRFEDLSCNAVNLDSCTGTTFTKVSARRIGGYFFAGSNKDRSTTFDRVDIQQINYNNWNVYGPSIAAVKLCKSQNPVFKNSIFANNNATALWFDQTVATPIVVNCLFQDNTNRGVDFETTSDGLAANCKFIHNGTVSIFINDSDTTRLYNNTFAENSWNLTATEGSNSAPTSHTCPLIQIGQSPRRYDVSQYSYCIDNTLPSSYYSTVPKHQWTINSFELVNNILVRAGVNTYSMMICGNQQDSTRPNRLFQPDFHPVMNGNVYHWGNNKPPYPWATAGGYNNNFGIYQTLAAFQAATSLDTNSSFTATDPLDSNYAVTNQTYHANATSLPADIAALIGQPVGTKHAGAFW